MANALLEKETLDSKDIDKIVAEGNVVVPEAVSPQEG
jgi:hypothetical protein